MSRRVPIGRLSPEAFSRGVFASGRETRSGRFFLGPQWCPTELALSFGNEFRQKTPLRRAETTWLFVLRNSQKTGLHESSPSPLFLSIKFLTTGHPPRPLSTATQRRCTKVLYRWIGTLSGCGPPEISDCRVQPRSGRSLRDIVSVLSRVGRRSRAPLSCVLFARSRSITSRPCVSVPSL